MTTELIEIEDRHGAKLTIYDGPGGCELLIQLPDGKSAKFNVWDDRSVEKILEGFNLSRNLGQVWEQSYR